MGDPTRQYLIDVYGERAVIDIEAWVSRIVADDQGFHRENRCVDTEACQDRQQQPGDWLREHPDAPLDQQWCSGCGEQMRVGQPHHKVYWPGHSEYRPPAPAARVSGDREGLDVERLARALLAAKWYAAGSLDDARITAGTIAAEYAALASSQDATPARPCPRCGRPDSARSCPDCYAEFATPADRPDAALRTALKLFREYRHLVGRTIHDLGGYKGLADDLGPLGDRIDAAIRAADRDGEGIEAAWREAEAALPEGMTIMRTSVERGSALVEAHRFSDHPLGSRHEQGFGEGETDRAALIAALRALAVRLQAKADEEGALS